MRVKKIIKYIKYILLTLILLEVLILSGGIIKYNIDLRSYINQDTSESSKIRKDPLSNGTEVYLLGTVHFETDKIKRNDIYHYLDSLSPSVILYENNTKTVNRLLNGTDFLNQFMISVGKLNSNERFITLKYKARHPDCDVFSYDWEERDAYHSKHNLNANSSAMINSVLRLYNDKLLEDHQSVIVEEYLKLNKELGEIHANGNIYDINSETTNNTIRERQFYVYKRIPEIVKEREDLSEYSEFVPFHMEYWDRRNKEMVKNILNQVKQNPNKRIVVLNGYYHRYYLMDELKKYTTELNFSVQ